MYADDTKIYREIREKHDQEIPQKDLDNLYIIAINHIKLHNIFKVSSQNMEGGGIKGMLPPPPPPPLSP